MRHSLAYVYKRFQKRIQGDDITVFDLPNACNNCVRDLNALIERPAVGGYEEQLSQDDESNVGETGENWDIF